MRLLRSRLPELVVAVAAGLATALLSAGLAASIAVAAAVALFAELTRRYAPDRALSPPDSLALLPSSGLHPLSKRETEVARLVADGLTNKEIAARIWRSDRVVDTHVQNSFNKLGFHNRSELTRWVVERDLGRPPDKSGEKPIPGNE